MVCKKAGNRVPPQAYRPHKQYVAGSPASWLSKLGVKMVHRDGRVYWTGLESASDESDGSDYSPSDTQSESEEESEQGTCAPERRLSSHSSCCSLIMTQSCTDSCGWRHPSRTSYKKHLRATMRDHSMVARAPLVQLGAAAGELLA